MCRYPVIEYSLGQDLCWIASSVVQVPVATCNCSFFVYFLLQMPDRMPVLSVWPRGTNPQTYFLSHCLWAPGILTVKKPPVWTAGHSQKPNFHGRWWSSTWKKSLFDAACSCTCRGSREGFPRSKWHCANVLSHTLFLYIFLKCKERRTLWNQMILFVTPCTNIWGKSEFVQFKQFSELLGSIFQTSSLDIDNLFFCFLLGCKIYHTKW